MNILTEAADASKFSLPEKLIVIIAEPSPRASIFPLESTQH